jgi:hypothetical protein
MKENTESCGQLNLDIHIAVNHVKFYESAGQAHITNIQNYLKHRVLQCKYSWSEIVGN